MKKCLFMDRDGTINVLKEDAYHLADSSSVVLIPGVEKLIKKFNDNGYMVIVISNQGGVGIGLYTEEDVYSIQEVITQKLKAYNAVIDDWYYCFHHHLKGLGKYKVECNCRKPGPANVLHAVNKYGIDKDKSFFIGDNITDAKCAENAGIRYYPFNYSGGIKTERGERIMIREYSDELIDKIFNMAEGK